MPRPPEAQRRHGREEAVAGDTEPRELRGRDVAVPDGWLEHAVAFYGPALELSRVRVRWSRLVIGPPGTAWTCNDVVRFKRSGDDGLPSEATFIHELAHVWQHQSGQAQLLRGFVEQVSRRLLGTDPYDYGGPDGVRGATALASLRKEAQAQIVTELWRARSGAESDRRGVPFSTPGYVEALERLVASAGIGTRSTMRRTVAGTIDAAVAWVVNAVANLVG